MHFFVILSAFIIGCAVQATPFSPATEGNALVLTKTRPTVTFITSPESALSAAVSSHGLHSLVDKTATKVTATSPVIATSPEKRQVILPVIVFCSASGCAGVCNAFTLIGDPLNTCFAPALDPFFSVFISNPSEVELLFQVGVVSNTACSGLLLLPETNVSFNISPFGESWAALTTGDTF
ncbi:hypothetical protein GALMADRAFT_216704 [Galerina marginata CBS 339.88]|uniref:Uncharacterized protein n=1 Tax=Galerina marginata (strain CBS 339.88) TaxID=685588 RepID=A0A067S837_GALM3|nr:hypothetical protein GALMADRAFT_216704 [Galerina marginata CBS 339.88]